MRDEGQGCFLFSFGGKRSVYRGADREEEVVLGLLLSLSWCPLIVKGLKRLESRCELHQAFAFSLFGWLDKAWFEIHTSSSASSRPLKVKHGKGWKSEQHWHQDFQAVHPKPNMGKAEKVSGTIIKPFQAVHQKPNRRKGEKLISANIKPFQAFNSMWQTVNGSRSHG